MDAQRAWRLLAAAIILASVGSVCYSAWTLRHGYVPPNGTSAEYPVGSMLDLDPSAFAGSPYTLVIFGRSSCAACQSAVGSITDLGDQIRSRHDIRLILATEFPDLPSEQAYARSLGLERSRVIRIDRPIKLRSVPTLALVNPSGRILFSQAGFGSTGQDRERLRAEVTAATAVGAAR